MNTQGFPVGIHLIFIPLTLIIGFVLGWLVRGVASQPPKRPPEGPPPPKTGKPPSGST